MLFKNVTLSLATIGLLGLGCVGDVSISQPGDPNDPGDGGGNDDPAANEQVLFDNTVEPILSANCAGAGCHAEISPIFIVGGVADYSAVVQSSALHGGSFDVESARLLTKIDEGHQAIVYSDDERQSIVTWINAEKALNNGSGGGDNVIASDREVLAAFSGCMTINNWNTVLMGDWADHRAEGQPCYACHSQGLSDFNTNQDPTIMFEKNKRFSPNPFILGFYTVGRDELTGDPVIIPAHIKLELMAEGGGEGGIHPTFEYGPGNAYYQKLESFLNLTNAYMAENPACKDLGFPE